MGLIHENQQRMFLGIANGKITHKTGADTPPETFAAVEGRLKSVTRRTVDIKGKGTEFLDILLEDNGQQYNLSTVLNGGVARSIILSLASIDSFVGAKVRFTAYLSRDGQHTNVMTEVNGQKVAWVTKDIPPVREVQIGSNVVKDDTDRLTFINKLVSSIQLHLDIASATPQAFFEGDLPGDDM